MFKLHLFKAFAFVIIFSSIWMFNGCEQTTTPDNNGGGNNSGSTVDHNSSITANETWSKDKTHVIDGYISITNGTVTIEPGATVVFKSGASINVSTGGGLIADGTSAKITFTGETKQSGFWDYIEFSDDAVNANCIMKNCLIEYGGGYSTSGAMLYIENNATVSNCTIRQSLSNGVEIDDSAFPTFTGNTVTANAKSPVTASFKNAGTIGKGTYTGNGYFYIDLSSGTIAQNATLLKQDIAYMLNGYNAVKNATLTIEAGTTIQMNSGADLTVSTGGGLIANGVASTNPITFTGAQEQNGYWDYIEFEDDAVNANCQMSNCVIQYGGGYSTTGAMVYIDNSPTFNNNTVQNSASYGVKIADKARPTFTGNVIRLNTLSPVHGDFESIGYIGQGQYSGNSQDYLDIDSGTLNGNATLLKLDVPYRLNGYNLVENGTLTINPGAVIEMNSGADLTIGTSGGIMAQGTDNDSITFTGAARQKGYWDYLEIQDDAISANCVLNKCIIEWGGGYSSSGAMIYLNKSNATLTNSLIQHSESWGIFYDNGSNPDLTGNVYNDNTLGDVKVQ